MASIAIDRRDGLSSSTAIKGPVRVATTANITLVGLQIIDGVALASGDRVLVKDQDTASENGIWVVDTGSWRRAKDFSRNDDVRTGTQVYVTDGDLYASSGWYVSSGNPTFGTSSIEFTQNVLLNAAQLVALEEAAGESADAAAASETAAEAAKDAAEAAKDIAEAAAAGIEGASVYSTIAQASAITPVAAPDFIRTAGYAAAGDGGGALYKKVASEPSHEGKLSITLADGVTVVWYEITGSRLNILQFGAVDDGVTPAQDAINAALLCAVAIGAEKVKSGPVSGTFVLTGVVNMQDGVEFCGNRQVALKRADSAASVLTLIDFGLTEKASMKDWIIDGNRAAVGDSDSHVDVRIGGGIDSIFNSNIVKNSPGYAVVVNTGLRATVNRNEIFNFHTSGIIVFGTGEQHVKEIIGNYIHAPGWGAMGVNDTTHAVVRGNTLIGVLIGGRDERLVVNTSGTTVTRVSGPEFTSVVPGNWLVINGGLEFRVASVDSADQLTTDPAFNGTLPTLSGEEASVGCGDLLGVAGSSYCKFENNTLEDAATFLFGFVASGRGNSFVANTLRRAGKCAVVMQDIDPGTLDDISLIGNLIEDAGYGGGIGTSDRIAIYIFPTAAGRVNNTLITGTTVTSSAGDGQTTYWLGTNGNMSPGSITANGNQANGLANDTIFGDVLSIELGAGWGSTATATLTKSTGDMVLFDIACSGTGFATFTPITITKVVEKNGWAPVPAIILNNAGGGASNNVPFTLMANSTRGVWVGYYNAAPASGYTYSLCVKD